MRTPLVPTEITADSGVTIKGPAVLSPLTPLEWIVTVTNHSATLAARAVLIISSSEIFDLQITGAPYTAHGDELFFDLGDLAAHQSTQVRVGGRLRPGRVYELYAHLLTAARDPVLVNNESMAREWTPPPKMDLGVTLVNAPMQVLFGEQFTVDVVVTNAGPATAYDADLLVSGALDQEYVFVGGIGITTNAFGTLVVGNLAPASSRSIQLWFRAQKPGLHVISIGPGTERDESNYANDFLSTAVYVAPEGGTPDPLGTRFPASARFAWDPLSRKLLVGFEQQFSGVIVLDPETMAPVGRTLISGYSAQMVAGKDGAHVWMFGVAGFTRVNYQTGASDMHFALDPSTPVYAMAATHHHPDTLVLITGDGYVRAFKNGLPQPRVHGPLNFFPSLYFASNGHLFASSGQQLRELELVGDGVAEIRNLDGAADWLATQYSDAKGRLFGADGTVLDLATGQRIGTSPVTLADAETGLGYVIPYGSPSFLLQSYDPISLEPVWHLPAPIPTVCTISGHERLAYGVRWILPGRSLQRVRS